MPWRESVALEFTLGEDRQDVVEFLDLLHLDALQDTALGRELRLPAFDIGNVDGMGLGDEAVDRSCGVEILHRHLEAEILGSLITDRLDDRIGDADVTKLDVLDFLRPDRGESTDRASSGGTTQQRAAGLEQRAPGRTFLCAGAIRNLI